MVGADGPSADGATLQGPPDSDFKRLPTQRNHGQIHCDHEYEYSGTRSWVKLVVPVHVTCTYACSVPEASSPSSSRSHTVLLRTDTVQLYRD